MLFVFFMRGVMFCSRLLFSRFHLFSVDFQESVDRIPDSGRDLQIACDKRIVGTELLFGNCEPRECPSQSTDLQSGKSGGLGGWDIVFSRGTEGQGTLGPLGLRLESRVRTSFIPRR